MVLRNLRLSGISAGIPAKKPFDVINQHTTVAIQLTPAILTTEALRPPPWAAGGPETGRQNVPAFLCPGSGSVGTSRTASRSVSAICVYARFLLIALADRFVPQRAQPVEHTGRDHADCLWTGLNILQCHGSIYVYLYGSGGRCGKSSRMSDAGIWLGRVSCCERFAFAHKPWCRGSVLHAGPSIARGLTLLQANRAARE